MPSRWSFLAMAFVLTADLPAQIINEVMYHPREETAPGVEDRRYEWIELYNENADPLDLSGYVFSRGVSFTFPPGTYLTGRTFLVVCANQALVRAKYGITNTIGDWSANTTLKNGGETITLTNASGAVITEVSYNDRGRWPAGADGTGHSLALLDPFSPIDDPDSWALSPTLGGSPGSANFGGQTTVKYTVIIDSNELWTYLKGTAAPPANWNTVGFPDAGWLSGATGIGYGDGDDSTVLTDMMGSYLSVYCRKKFTVADLSAVESLILTVDYDDGFVAYLNGTEVARANMAGNPPAFNAAATASHEASRGDNNPQPPQDFDITSQKGLLTAGSNNVLAVQVHNSSLTSSDLSFIPKLVSREVILPSQIATLPVVLNEGFLRTAGERWVEIYNTSNAAVNLSGYHFTDDPRDLLKATLPAATSLPARGRKPFSDTELGLNFSLQSPARDRVLVALVNPAGTRVVDAYTFKPVLDERSEARVPDGDREMQPAAVPTRGTANRSDPVGGGNVVLNEIMYNPISGDPADEYLELYNRGSSAVDLAGFQLAKAVEFAFPDISIGPGEYLVVAGSPDRIVQRYGLPASQVLGPWYRLKEDAQGHPIYEPASLKDGGDRINLLDPWGNVENSVHYFHGGEWPIWPDGGGSSLELIDPFQDNDTPQAWDASDDSAQSVPVEYSYTAKHAGGESELHLLLLDKGIAIVDGVSLKKGTTEYVDNGDFESDAQSWLIEGTHVHSGQTSDPELVIDGAGSLKIVASSGGDEKVNRIETYPDLLAPLDTSSTYTITFLARWIVGSQSILTRGYNHGLARSHRLAVPDRLGTPGAVNSVTLRQIAQVGSANLGPVIDRVSHLPAVPGASEPVTVSARVRDPDGIKPGSVKLFYVLNTPPATPAGFAALNMTGPDPDGFYQGTIPGQTLGTRVVFFISAQDQPGNSGRYPIDYTTRTHPLLLDPANASLNDLRYVVYRHDQKIPATPYHSYRFVMTQANQDYLFNRPVFSNELVEGTFVFGSDRAYYNAGIHWSGSPFLRGRTWGNSYRVSFPADNPLHGKIKSFNLEDHSTDGRERISHYLIRYNNVPGVKVPYAPEFYVRWQVNDQVNSVYAHVLHPDGNYLKFWYPGDDNGDFFEMDDRFEFTDDGNRASNQDGRMTFPPYSNAVYPTPDPPDYQVWRENYRYYLNPRSNESDDSWKNLIEFSKVLDPVKTSSTAFDAVIYQVADVEAMLRVWAVRMSTDDWDTWGDSRGKNCYLYRRPSDGRWVLIPWDMELTYGNVNSFPLGSTPSQAIPVSGMFPEVGRLLNRPQIKRRFYGILKEMVDRQFNSDFLTPWMDLLAANGTQNTQVGRPGGFIDQRAALIRNWIQPVVYPQQRLTITTGSGNPFSTANVAVDIAGAAPVEIYQIVITRDGTPLSPQPQVAFSTTDMKGWTAKAIPLVSGVNHLAFLGYTGDPNDLVDSAAIDVTFTGTQTPPVLSTVDPTSGPTGLSVTLTGSSFQTGLKVLFGAVEASSVTFSPADPTHITAAVPAGLSNGATQVKVRNPDGLESSSQPFNVVAGFIRGDANLDGSVDVSDAIKVLMVLFAGQSTTCRDALDVDDSGTLNATDAIRLLIYLFQAGAAPAAPFPQKGVDPTADALTCDQGL